MFEQKWEIFKFLEEGGVLTTKQWKTRNSNMFVRFNPKTQKYVDESGDTVSDMLDLVYLEFDIEDWVVVLNQTSIKRD